MGCCSSTPISPDLSYTVNTNPEEWTQNQVTQWLKYSCDGELSDLVEPFRLERISGATLSKLTDDDLLNKLNIKPFGLREQFIYQRDKILEYYHTHNITHNNDENILSNHIINNQTTNVSKSKPRKRANSSTVKLKKGASWHKSDNKTDVDADEHVVEIFGIDEHVQNAPKISSNVAINVIVNDLDLSAKDSLDTNATHRQSMVSHYNERSHTLGIKLLATQSIPNELYNNKLLTNKPKIRTSILKEPASIILSRKSQLHSPKNGLNGISGINGGLIGGISGSFYNINRKRQSYKPRTYTPIAFKTSKLTPHAHIPVHDDNVYDEIDVNSLPQLDVQLQPNDNSAIAINFDRKDWKIIVDDDDDDVDDHNYNLNPLSIQQVKLENSAPIEKLHDGDNDLDDYILTQYGNHCYINCSSLVINRFIFEIEQLISINIPTVINKLCIEYYFEYSLHVLQFGYDVYYILNNLLSNQIHKYDVGLNNTFTGKKLISRTSDLYSSKYNNNDDKDVMKTYCNDLVKYGYIKLIAKKKDLSLSHKDSDTDNDIPHHILQNLWRETIDDNKSSDGKYDDDISSENCLYKFNKIRQLSFEKYQYFIREKPDRKSWRIGTKILIFSSSLGGWQDGYIIEINDQNINVSYGENDNKYLKKVQKSDISLCKSTRDYIINRKKFNIGSKIEIYSNSSNMWCRGIITQKREISPPHQMEDIFCVFYKRNGNNGPEYSKYVTRWSQDIRSISSISSISSPYDYKYQSGTKLKVWSNSKKQWLIGHIKDILPIQKKLIVVYNKNEKIVDIDSNEIQWIK